MEIVMGNISEMKPKAELKTGGGDHNSGADAVMVEKVSNGWVLRIIDLATEMEEILVFTESQRPELLKAIAKNV